MNGERPALIVIDHDDYHAKYVGRTADGHQFFATTPFVPAGPATPGREFIAVYLFDARGRLLEARIDDLGARANVNSEAADQLFQRRITELGRITPGRIEVAPFEVERFGATFGLVARAPEEGAEDGWWVEAQPGNFMAFHEPWDSGEYDT